jgi:hypothetical protein
MPSHRTSHTASGLLRCLIVGLLVIGSLAGLGSLLSSTQADDTAGLAGPHPTAAQRGVEPVTVTAPPKAAPAPRQVAQPVSDDDPRFDCRTGGNRTCGPNNPQHVTPGCYWQGRLLVAWQPAMREHWVNCGDPTPGDWHMEYRVTGGRYGIPA